MAKSGRGGVTEDGRKGYLPVKQFGCVKLQCQLMSQYNVDTAMGELAVLHTQMENKVTSKCRNIWLSQSKQ